jgi:hypothetical protein
VIHTARGRRDTSRPTAPHRREAFAGGSTPSTGSTNFGRNGQNAVRPNSTSSAGNAVNAASRAKKMPTAATGPRPRFEFSPDSSRQSTPRMTVAADATIGSTAARSATRMASHGMRWVISASRNRATSSSE